ncbi:MAG TPA: hypothetical protein PLU35_05485 [Phycisphaerales bacterium]|nr:hypothetical protein [Phycisphaerales bacterium]
MVKAIRETACFLLLIAVPLALLVLVQYVPRWVTFSIVVGFVAMMLIGGAQTEDWIKRPRDYVVYFGLMGLWLCAVVFAHPLVSRLEEEWALPTVLTLLVLGTVVGLVCVLWRRRRK